ncbi:MAG: ABC transporter permease [Planctomycetota bacterium]|nr:ABC transporter permease [Planctomycetota bacterium]
MLSLVFRTIAHFYRLLLPVALGVAISSAVIVGALLVGDSMRGSLRFIALDRIGSIQRMVVAPRWFHQSALQTAQSSSGPGSVLGLIWIQAVVAEHQDRSEEAEGKITTHRVTEMTLLGVDENFWSLGTIRPTSVLGDEQVILNRSLADELKVKIGQRITLKVSRDAVVPADSALGKRDTEVVALSRWLVVDIVPDESLGRFSLRSDQRPVLNAYVSKESLQKALEIQEQINAVASSKPDPEPLLPTLQLSLDDLGLRWERIQRVFPDESIGETLGESLAPGSKPVEVFDYDQLTSQQMMIPDALADALADGSSRRVLSYLANNTQVLRNQGSDAQGRSVAYSIISGVDWELIDRMLSDGRSEPLPKDWVVIHDWMAKELDAKVGDRLRIDYFLPETVEGTEVETSFEASIVAIGPLREPVQAYRRKSPARFAAPPTLFNDPAWTPLVPGITDQESISNWETPFALTRKIEKQDDEYWNSHRLTPKLFISEQRAKELFGSRFGSQTGLRFDGLSDAQRQEQADRILAAAKGKLTQLGWRELPLRAQQLKASSGTTPFDALFLSLSFFVIAAALILVALLFRLTIEKRAEHWGLLLASGWTRSKVRRLLLIESALIAAIGSAVGVVLGVAYAYALLAGLKSWWVGAISVSFLDFHIRPQSLWIGWLAGLLVSLATTWFVTRQLRKASIARLLKGRMDDQAPSHQANRMIRYGAIGCFLLGVLALLAGQWAQGQAQAGAFVFSGMLWMIAMVLWLYTHMRRSSGSLTKSMPESLESPKLDLSSLARSNAQRAPLRSILTVALMAMASFLILAMSLFQAQPDRRGTGGFAWIARSSQSIHVNIADPKQQRQSLGDKAQALVDAMIVPIRVRGGDDASCNNLYQAAEPQVMGIASSMLTADRDAQGNSEFAWFATDVRQSPWKRLETLADGTQEDPLPVILDQNTALWALHLGGYVGEKFSYTFGQKKVEFQTVGVLQNTVLQGSLWIADGNFQRVFPDIGGYRAFLVKPQTGTTEQGIESIRVALEGGWSDEGFSCASADGVLSRLLAVQNTYLSAFQLLGGLGLLLGTLGLGVSQLRSALERKSELAAMRAMGFPKARLVWSLFLENGWQLFRGLGIGMFCAAAASAPVLLRGNSVVSLTGPLSMLGWVILIGLLFCVSAAVLAMRQPLLGALRSDR